MAKTQHLPAKFDPSPRDARFRAHREAGMIQVKRFSHATFETPDVERQVDYFAQVVGLAVAGKQNGQVDPSTSFADIRKGLDAEGIKSEERSDAAPGIPKAIVFKDPKGTAIEIFAEQKPIAGSQPVAGIGPIKLGHLAFCVDDCKAYADFYCKVMGFRVSDWIQDWFVFLRCGPDHHTINFVQGKRTMMHHVAFELKDWAQVQQAMDFLGSKNINLAWGPGRHGPGHNIYTYHRNPDDQIIELFTELDKMLDESLGYFDPRPWHRDHPQRPKVWTDRRDIWGMPPNAEYIRQRE
jgi:catechol 2,3-dioxygenase-like lactoylglutathione lyase family enzyme